MYLCASVTVLYRVIVRLNAKAYTAINDNFLVHAMICEDILQKRKLTLTYKLCNIINDRFIRNDPKFVVVATTTCVACYYIYYHKIENCLQWML